jgi:hypothetical protein
MHQLDKVSSASVGPWFGVQPNAVVEGRPAKGGGDRDQNEACAFLLLADQAPGVLVLGLEGPANLGRSHQGNDELSAEQV